MLAGDLGSNRFVFGQGSGVDLITCFSHASGDRLDLQEQSYSTGTTAGGSALLTLSGGGTIELSGVAASQIDAGFFATDTA